MTTQDLENAAPDPVHEVQSDLEKEVLPGWLDHDPAADEPNYMGYILSFLPALLLFVFALLAGVVAYRHFSAPQRADAGDAPMSAVEAPTR